MNQCAGAGASTEESLWYEVARWRARAHSHAVKIAQVYEGIADMKASDYRLADAEGMDEPISFGHLK